MKPLAVMNKAGVMVYSTEGNNACPPRLSSNVGDWLLAIIARDEWRGMGRGRLLQINLPQLPSVWYTSKAFVLGCFVSQCCP